MIFYTPPFSRKQSITKYIIEYKKTLQVPYHGISSVFRGWAIQLRITARRGIEPLFSPWEGDVLTAWPTSLCKSYFDIISYNQLFGKYFFNFFLIYYIDTNIAIFKDENFFNLYVNVDVRSLKEYLKELAPWIQHETVQIKRI